MTKESAPQKEQASYVEQPKGEAALKSSGHVEVVRLKRRSRKHPELLLFKGAPASRHSVAKSVLIEITTDPSLAKAPWMDLEKGRIHLCYASMEHPEVAALISDPGGWLCYLWTSSDGKQSHAWFLRAGAAPSGRKSVKRR